MYQAVRVNHVGRLGATLGSQLGQPGSLLIDVPVRHVECSAIGLADLTDFTQFNWTCAAIKDELKQDAAAAAAMARTASRFIKIRALTNWRRSLRSFFWLPT